MAKHTKTVIGLLAVLLVIFFFDTGLTSESRAQTPGLKFLVTWQAKSYVPPQYSGKILPTMGSRITVVFDVVSGGKIVDLSGQPISWYLGEQTLGSGRGMQSITFLAPDGSAGYIDLRIELQQDDQSKLRISQLLIKTLQIPIVNPEAVIEAPYPGGIFGGYSPQVSGMPYFFSVSSPSALNYTWSVNGENPQNAENPSLLTVDLNQDAPLGSTISIGLTIQDPRNATAAAQAYTGLTLGK